MIQRFLMEYGELPQRTQKDTKTVRFIFVSFCAFRGQSLRIENQAGRTEMAADRLMGMVSITQQFEIAPKNLSADPSTMCRNLTSQVFRIEDVP